MFLYSNYLPNKYLEFAETEFEGAIRRHTMRFSLLTSIAARSNPPRSMTISGVVGWLAG